MLHHRWQLFFVRGGGASRSAVRLRCAMCMSSSGSGGRQVASRAGAASVDDPGQVSIEGTVLTARVSTLRLGDSTEWSEGAVTCVATLIPD